MAVALGVVGTTGSNTVAGTILNVPYPSPCNANDLLVLHISTNGGAVTNPASPWVVVYNNGGAVVPNPRGGLWIKVADGTETGNLAVTTGNVLSSGSMVSFTGVDTTTPQDAASTLIENAATGTSVVCPAITTVTADTMLVYCDAPNSATVTSTGPGTEDKDYGQEVAGGKGGAVYHEAFVGPGSTGTRTMTLSAARANWGVMIALRPAAGAVALPPIIVMPPRRP